MKISFSPPLIDQSVLDEVTETLQSGWITTGNKVKTFENKIKSFTGAKSVLCVNSWTSGAILVLKWLGLNPGDEVIVPAYTYAATAFAVIHAGGTPVIVDINDDFNISLEEIKKAITPKTKAIIPVDVAGWPADYYEIMNLVNSDSIKQQFNPESEVQKKLGRILVLSDAAHSFGAKIKGKFVGAQTDVVIFSFHAVKNITTAEGGAICLNLPSEFNNSHEYEALRITSMNCQTKDAYSKSIAGCWKYDIIGLGMKINMPDVNAAIGLAQLKILPEMLVERKEIARKYSQKLLKFDWVTIPTLFDEEKESSYHFYPLRIKGIDELERDLIINEMSKFGIATNVHFIPLPMFSYFKNSGFDIAKFPKSFANYCNEISLPIYPQLTEKEVSYIVDSLIKSYLKVVNIK